MKSIAFTVILLLINGFKRFSREKSKRLILCIATYKLPGKAGDQNGLRRKCLIVTMKTHEDRYSWLTKAVTQGPLKFRVSSLQVLGNRQLYSVLGMIFCCCCLGFCYCFRYKLVNNLIVHVLKSSQDIYLSHSGNYTAFIIW